MTDLERVLGKLRDTVNLSNMTDYWRDVAFGLFEVVDAASTIDFRQTSHWAQQAMGFDRLANLESSIKLLVALVEAPNDK